MHTSNGTSNGKPIIQLRDVVKAFPVGDDQVTVLHGISLEVERGEFVSIVGPSGNGKSTSRRRATLLHRQSGCSSRQAALHRISTSVTTGRRWLHIRAAGNSDPEHRKAAEVLPYSLTNSSFTPAARRAEFK